MPRLLLLICWLSCWLPTSDGLSQQHIVVVLDDSGSMSARMSGAANRMTAAKDALLAVLADLPPDTELGILTLNTTINGDHWVVPFGKIDESVYRPRIGAIRAFGGTPLGAAMKSAADRLLQQRQQNIYGTYRLLVVTDGEATDRRRLESYLPDIRSRGILLDVIGVSMATRHTLAQTADTYRSANDPNALRVAIGEILAEAGGATDDTVEDDFAWLNAIPDETAVASLAAIAAVQRNNTPISEQPPYRFPDGRVLPGQDTGATSSGLDSQTGLSLLGTCCCFFIIVFIGLLFLLFFVNRKR